MNINLGNADAGVAIAISVLGDYLTELMRIGKLPNTLLLTRDVNGEPVEITVLLNPPSFELAQPVNEAPYTRLLLTGSIEIRPAGQPDATPLVLPLNAAIRLSLVLVGPANTVPEVGFRYDGADGPPAPPVTEADLDELFTNPDIASVINETRIPLANTLVEGINESRFPIAGLRPDPADWSIVLTLMPAGVDTVDSFAVTVAPPGLIAEPNIVESFVVPNTGLAVAYSRQFLDLMLAVGAAARVGQTISGADVKDLSLKMADSAIAVKGHVVRPVDTPVVDILPDVDIHFEGPMVPSLVRGTTGMAFDTSGVKIDIDDSDEIFFAVLKWFVTIGASALLFTGWGSLTALGILLWITLVQEVWNGDAELDNAPNLLRDSLATSLGAQLSILASSLDDDTAVGELRIDATPDSLLVVTGNMILFAQILVVPLAAMMQSAEYSKSLRRFVIFELQDGRRFRAQELARLMKAGKVTVPGFHQVSGNYLRADPDNVAANNLLQQFKENLTNEVVVRSKR